MEWAQDYINSTVRGGVMVYQVSNLFKQYVVQPDRQFEFKADIAGVTYDNTKLIDFEIDDSLIAADDFTVGTAISSHLNISIRTQDIVPSNAKIVPYARLNGLSGYTEWVKLGEYYVDTRSSENGVLTFSCYDILILSHQPFISLLTYPASMSSVFNEVCTKLGVTKDESAYINPSYMIQAKPIGYNMHDIIAYIAMANAASIQITRDGKLGFIKFSMSKIKTTVIPSQIIKVKATNPSKAITKIVCTYDNKGSVYTSGKGDDYHTLMMNNPFINQSILDSVRSSLDGFSYTPYNMDWRGNLFSDLGDLIQISLKDGTFLSSTILTRKTSFRGGVRETVTSPAYSAQRSEFVFAGGYQETSEPEITDISIQDDSISIVYDDYSMNTYTLTKDAQGRITAIGKDDGIINIRYTDTLVNPLFQSASTTKDGNSVVVAFDHIMVNPTEQQKNFIVKIDGVKATILSTEHGNFNTKISLNLYETAGITSVVTVEYIRPDSGASTELRSIQNFPLLSFAAQPVSNIAAAPPTFVSASTNDTGTIIFVEFTKPMDDPADQFQQFEVTTSTDWHKFPMSAVLNADKKKIEINIRIPISYGEIVYLDYAAPHSSGLQGADGSDVLSFSHKLITNNTPASTHQKWNAYDDSPLLTSVYPYQLAGQRSGKPDVLIYSQTPIKWSLGFLSSDTGLSYSEWIENDWVYLHTGIESEFVNVVECNNNVVSVLDGATIIYYKTI